MTQREQWWPRLAGEGFFKSKMPIGGCWTCRGAKIVGGNRYHAAGSLTDARPCPDCTDSANGEFEETK